MDEESNLFNRKLNDVESTVHQSFQRIYIALKAKEAITLRQLEAIRKQCEHDVKFRKDCIQNINASLANCEPVISSINNLELLNLNDLNFESTALKMEDYEPPSTDHHLSHKSIKNEPLNEGDSSEISAKNISSRHSNTLTPTQDWLNYIKQQTEIEPQQAEPDTIKHGSPK